MAPLIACMRVHQFCQRPSTSTSRGINQRSCQDQHRAQARAAHILLLPAALRPRQVLLAVFYSVLPMLSCASCLFTGFVLSLHRHHRRGPSLLAPPVPAFSCASCPRPRASVFPSRVPSPRLRGLLLCFPLLGFPLLHNCFLLLFPVLLPSPSLHLAERKLRKHSFDLNVRRDALHKLSCCFRGAEDELSCRALPSDFDRKRLKIHGFAERIDMLNLGGGV